LIAVNPAAMALHKQSHHLAFVFRPHGTDFRDYPTDNLSDFGFPKLLWQVALQNLELRALAVRQIRAACLVISFYSLSTTLCFPLDHLRDAVIVEIFALVYFRVPNSGPDEPDSGQHNLVMGLHGPLHLFDELLFGAHVPHTTLALPPGIALPPRCALFAPSRGLFSALFVAGLFVMLMRPSFLQNASFLQSLLESF
jgi:hypothetical protein